MLDRLKTFVYTWVMTVVAMALQKPLFVLLQPTYNLQDAGILPQIMWHGLSMDISMASYVCAPVLIWVIATVWYTKPWMKRVLLAYLGMAAALIAGCGVADAALYPYWQFRLDSTPLFYLATSPASAFASVSWWQIAAVIAAWAVTAWLLYLLLSWPARKTVIRPARRRVAVTLVWSVLGATMIIPIRGGVTVSTMAPGRAYFSDNMRLNHAALNPMFNLVHSLTHADRLGTSFRFMDDTQSRTLAAQVADSTMVPPADSLVIKSRPDVYIIILESFSAHVMPSLGGDSTAMNLDRIAAGGTLFTDFAAESFRTDRALATILSGLPAMPTTSVLKYTRKFGNLPSLASSLSRHGYRTEYYYGGDLDFTNLRAYLLATGFKKTTGDTDFAVGKRLSKWGVHDGDLFDRIWQDLQADKDTTPALRVIQTSSSHEPYDVPGRRFADDRRNAFAYADSCLGDFVGKLQKSRRWQNALVVILADHWGSYPPDLADAGARHHIPLVITGGARPALPKRIDTPASQSAVAPTLLAMLGYDAQDFAWPRNMLDDTRQKQYKWIADPEYVILQTPHDTTFINVRTNDATGGGTQPTKAFLQQIYRNLDRR